MHGAHYVSLFLSLKRNCEKRLLGILVTAVNCRTSRMRQSSESCVLRITSQKRGRGTETKLEKNGAFGESFQKLFSLDRPRVLPVTHVTAGTIS